MHTLDYTIVIAYLAILAIIGALLAKRAGASPEHYFLGGRSMPWWALGASGMASNLDVAGTTTLVALLYSYGIHGFFIEMRGGVVLPIAVFLAFMGKWHRRSGAMTTAEWMTLRFGDGRQGKAARLTAAATYLVITVAMTVFFFAASGKFLTGLIPFGPQTCAALMALVAFSYTLMGGLYGVVWTDVFQAGIIGAAAVYVALKAGVLVDADLLAAWPGAELSRSFLPFGQHEALGVYSSFGAFLGVWLFKGILEGLGGSGGSAYMAQRFYATRSDAECQKLGMLWTVLFAFRWPLVLGFVLLAVKLGLDASTPEGAETFIPQVLLSEYFPIGVRGLLVAALLAAAMSTFDSTVNAGASYVVKDIYEPLFGAGSPRRMVWVGYVASAAIVGLGLLISILAGAGVLAIWVSIVMLLFPAFLVPFALRWFWSRFNGAGFTVGVLSGFAAAVVVHFAAPATMNEAERFLAISAFSLLASLAGTFLSAPVDETTLRAFHRKTKPFGLWPRSWSEENPREFPGDLARLGAALVWQILTFLLPMGILLRLWSSVFPTAVLWTALLVYLLWDVRKTERREASLKG